MISTRNKQEIIELIQGPVGKLEIAKSPPVGKERGAWGIVCHPHPLHGGTMDNKVVTTLVKTFQDLGLSTVRFNFRGVGRSEGTYDQGKGELFDLLAVIEWVLRDRPDHAIWLGGFSFGAFVAAKAATQIPTAKLVTIAPPVVNCHMDTLPQIPCPWVLVQGEKDDVVSAEDVFAWAKTRDPQPVIIRFPTAGHFFHGQLVELRQKLEEALG